MAKVNVMKDYPELRDLGDRQQTITSPILLVGERNKHLGPRIDFAKVSVRFKPSEKFEVIDLVGADDGARKFGFPDQFISGLLEILTANKNGPLTRISVTLMEAAHDAIDSSPRAFFEAGRDAGRQLLNVNGEER
jgi:hypothetical protein